MRLNHPSGTNLEQGAIFNCINVTDYEDCACWGVVINARCDLAHDKAAVVNILPIVRFRDWSERGLITIIAKRIESELRSKTRNLLKQKKGVSDRLLETFSWIDVVKKEFKIREQAGLLKNIQLLKHLEDAGSLGGRHCHHAKDILNANTKETERIIHELIQHKINDYYFLDAVDIYSNPSEGFVVLMRRLHTIKIDEANQLCSGINSDDTKKREAFGDKLSFKHEPICMCTGVLRSPDIEHLIQHYANLFMRIGLDDYEDSVLKFHTNLLIENKTL